MTSLTQNDLAFLIQMMRSNYEIQKLEVFKKLEETLVKIQKESQ